MKSILAAIFLLTASTTFSQYYYQDIIGTKESTELANSYKNNKVRSVVVTSYDANNVRMENIYIRQLFSPVQLTLTTVTRSETTHPSSLVTYLDASGKIYKTIDSSALVINQTHYLYNAAGQLISISTTSIDSAKTGAQSEEHIWHYDGGKISKMLRIKNKVDTTIVHFKLDGNGNVIEEQAVRKGRKAEVVYYFYDDDNRLTDIVRYNNKARRLLPEYLFEYGPTGKIIQRITVPANSSNYVIWRYQYDQKGLKVKEAIYNKQKELTGKIEYQYSFGS